ncbi:alpha/beta fold hydrolase [Acidiferrobacter sp.]|uniref:alpha/beta hydrolase n=1 Tax=Acidiferrobacter sp. TaxID=1872107 RepID=UPI002607EED5|nr:alpha/beta fold hydrolase [Acidiferrobacter sp.]
MHESAFSLTTRPGVLIRGWMADTGNSPVGLFLHGFRSHCAGEKALALTTHALARGYSWVRFDLAAHGASTGVFAQQTLSGWLEDSLSVARLFAPRPLILVGSSLGAWLAVLMARGSDLPVAGLVLLAPALNFLQRSAASLPHDRLARWQGAGRCLFPDPYGPPGTVYELDYGLVLDAATHDVLSSPVTLPCPLSVIHGDHDELVPLSVSEDFVSRVRAPVKRLTVVPDGDHRLTGAIPLILAEVDALWTSAAGGAGARA